MENTKFEYDLFFETEEYLTTKESLEELIKLAKRCAKNLKDQGRIGTYQIKYLGITIAQY